MSVHAGHPLLPCLNIKMIKKYERVHRYCDTVRQNGTDLFIFSCKEGEEQFKVEVSSILTIESTSLS